jgi:hypothetical protein
MQELCTIINKKIYQRVLVRQFTLKEEDAERLFKLDKIIKFL